MFLIYNTKYNNKKKHPILRLNKLMAKVLSSLSPIHTYVCTKYSTQLHIYSTRSRIYIAQHQSHLSNWKIDFRFYEMLLRKMCIYSFDICTHQTKAKSTFNLKVHNYENPLLRCKYYLLFRDLQYTYIHTIRKCDAIVLISPSSTTSRRPLCFVYKRQIYIFLLNCLGYEINIYLRVSVIRN